MQDESAVPDTTPGQPETVAALVEEIRSLRTRAEAAALSAEEASRKANSEAGYAFNAKQHAEEHAKTVAQVKGAVEADSNWFATTRKNSDEAAQAIATVRSTADGDARSIMQAKTAAEKVVASLQGTQEKGDVAFSAIERLQNEAVPIGKRLADDAAAVTKERANIEASAGTVQALQSQVSEAAAKAQTDCSAIAGRNGESQSHLQSIADIVAKSRTTFDSVVLYEAELAKLQTEIRGLHAKIESLLPGATSAGLASAFRDQKSRFDWPQRIWLGAFVFAIAGLFAVGLYGFQQFVNEAVTWDATLRHVVSRLPLIIPLVWLALYAGRAYMHALRLQEDYAYKEAISTSFEGYRREMAAIPANAEQLQPILHLCDNVLRTLSQRPGRLYDGKHDDVTPLTPLMKLAKEIGLLKNSTGSSEPGT